MEIPSPFSVRGGQSLSITRGRPPGKHEALAVTFFILIPVAKSSDEASCSCIGG